MKFQHIDQEQLKHAYGIVKGEHIPPIPKTLLSLRQELNSLDPDLKKIVDLISEDIALSGRIIKSINSAAFGIRNEISSIEHAAVMLGIRKLKDLIINAAMRKALEDSLQGFTDITNHSSKVAHAAYLIAETSGKCLKDEAYVAGLFHLAGVMILMRKFDEYVDLFEKYQQMPKTLVARESELFGSNYPLVSFILAYHWKLPENVLNAIACQALPLGDIDDDLKALVATLKVAAYLVFGQNAGDDMERAGDYELNEALVVLELEDGQLIEIAATLAMG